MRDAKSKDIKDINKKKEFYLGMTILTAVGYTLSIFIQSENETGKNIASFFHYCLYFSSIIFATFWIRRQIMIIALFFDFIYFNLKLLINPILFRVDYFYTYNHYLLETGLIILSSILLCIGLWKNVPVKFARKEFYFKESVILVPIIVFTLLIQILSRFIF